MTAQPLSPLLEQLRERGADRRNGPAALRAAYMDLSRQVAEPDLFIETSVETARAALAADETRFAREKAADFARQCARHVRERKRAARCETLWASCCQRLYYYTPGPLGELPPVPRPTHLRQSDPRSAFRVVRAYHPTTAPDCA